MMANFNYIAYLGQAHAPVQANTQQPVTSQHAYLSQAHAPVHANSQQPVTSQHAYLSQAHAPVRIQQATDDTQQHMINQHANSGHDLYLKVLSPENKKEYRTVNLRGLHHEAIDTPSKLKVAISVQCDGLDPQNMEVGYFNHSKKLWINSRLDINDIWSMVEKGEKLTLWCLDTTTRESQKRKHDEQDDEQVQTKKRCSLHLKKGRSKLKNMNKS